MKIVDHIKEHEALGITDALLNKSASANTMIITGDSNAASYSAESAGQYSVYASTNPVNRLNQNLGQSFTVVRNTGISGNTTSQFAARFDTDVVAYKSEANYLYIQIGTNNTGGNMDTEAEVDAAIADVTGTLVKAQNAGFITFVSAIPPRGSVAGGSIGAGDAFGLYMFNRKMEDWCADKDNIVYVNVNSLLVDYTDQSTLASGWWAPNYCDTAGLHYSALGANKAAAGIQDVISTVMPGIGARSSGVRSAAAGDSINPLLNSMMYDGTTHTGGTGASGVFVESWSCARVNGANITAVGSKVAKADTANGEWQRITLANSLGATEAIEFSQNVSLTDSEPDLAVGDTVYAEIQVACNVTSGDLTKLQLLAKVNNSGASQIFWAMDGRIGETTSTSYASTDTGCEVTGTLRTPNFELEATADNIDFIVRMGTSSGGGATVDLIGAVIRKVYPDA
jgi:lysophospholipase L1-like esterase